MFVVYDRAAAFSRVGITEPWSITKILDSRSLVDLPPGGPVHLVGHSCGALVCLDVALLVTWTDPQGGQAGDLPMELPIKYEFVVNLKIAKSLSLAVPPTLLTPRRRGDRITSLIGTFRT
jgi:hypothetical protein